MDLSAAGLDQLNNAINELIQPTAPKMVENEAGDQVLSREYKESGLDKFRVYDGHKQCAYYEPLRMNVNWLPGVELQQRAETAPQFYNVIEEYERLTKLLNKLKEQTIKYKLDVLFQFKEFDAREFQRHVTKMERLKNKLTSLVLFIIQQRLPTDVNTAASPTASMSTTSPTSLRSSEQSSEGSIRDFVESDTEDTPQVSLRELMRQASYSTSPASASTEPAPIMLPTFSKLTFDELIEKINDLLVQIKNLAKTELDDHGVSELVELQRERSDAMQQLMRRKYKFNHVEIPNGWFKVGAASAEEEKRLMEQQAAMQDVGEAETDTEVGENIFANDSPVGGSKNEQQQQHGGYLVKVDGRLAQKHGCDSTVPYEDVNIKYDWLARARYPYALKQQAYTLRNFIVQVEKK
jgi:hypothetical protein